ncbi:MAG: hypothetical protein IE916_00615 [Epsilonproteobacteria bacterium]|nr:hypothetical protein [Campylobacterota bacterium]
MLSTEAGFQLQKQSKEKRLKVVAHLSQVGKKTNNNEEKKSGLSSMLATLGEIFFSKKSAPAKNIDKVDIETKSVPGNGELEDDLNKPGFLEKNLELKIFALIVIIVLGYSQIKKYVAFDSAPASQVSQTMQTENGAENKKKAMVNSGASPLGLSLKKEKVADDSKVAVPTSSTPASTQDTTTAASSKKPELPIVNKVTANTASAPETKDLPDPNDLVTIKKGAYTVIGNSKEFTIIGDSIRFIINSTPYKENSELDKGYKLGSFSYNASGKKRLGDIEIKTVLEYKGIQEPIKSITIPLSELYEFKFFEGGISMREITTGRETGIVLPGEKFNALFNLVEINERMDSFTYKVRFFDGKTFSFNIPLSKIL